MMKRILAALLVITLIFTAFPLSNAKSGGISAPESGNYVANEILLTLAEGGLQAPLPVESSERLETAALDKDERVFKCTVAYGTDIPALCKALEQRADIALAEPNYLQTIDAIDLPVEAQIKDAEHNAFHWYADALALETAWQNAGTLGSEEVTVAVIDTGVNTAHTEFEGAMWEDAEGHNGYNAIEDNYDVSDENGHGSNVAGIIAMRANGFGYVGIAPGVKIMALKAAQGITFSDDAILECLNFALENGADIINLSFGGSDISDTMAKAYARASAKAVVIAAAGNSGTDAQNELEYPAACSGVVGVMSYGSYNDSAFTNYTHDTGELSSFSNYDASGKYYQIAAPGVNIAGPAPTGTTDFSFKNGTSQAAPMVAGAAALYISLHPGATPYQVKQALINGSNKTLTGYYDDASYRGLNLPAVLAEPLCEDGEVALSDTALAILNECLESDYTTVHLSEVESVSVIENSLAAKYKENLQALAELPYIQFLFLNGIDLTNQELNRLCEARFKQLYRLDLSNNPQLSKLNIHPESAPTLLELYADNCAFNNTDSLKNLPHLRTLSLCGNALVYSEQFAALSSLHQLSLSGCQLQDVNAFARFSELTYLDISDNYITDISPLAAFTGAYLNISSNPLSLGVRQNYYVKSIEYFMNKNDYAHSSIHFYHNDLNAADGKEYRKATAMTLPVQAVARTAQAAQLALFTEPADANTCSAALYRTDSTLVALDSMQGELSWNAADISHSTSIPIQVEPVAGFPAFETSVHILAPEITAFSYTGGAYTLTANKATEYITVGDMRLNTFHEESEERIFTVPTSLPYSDGLSATACDSLGAGESKLIGEKIKAKHTSAQIFSFSADKEAYFCGDTAILEVKTNSFTNAVKLTDDSSRVSITAEAFENTADGRVFRFFVPLHSAKSYRFRAYASADGNFSIGAKVLSFTANIAPTALKLCSKTGSTLYFNDHNRQLHLEALFFPQNSACALEFHSSNPGVATVDKNGVVSATGYGMCFITAQSENGLVADYPIVVSAPKLTEPEINAGYYNEASFLDFYANGATQIILKNADGSDVDFEYEYEEYESNIDGYESEWYVALYTASPEVLHLRVYAADENGIQGNTPYRVITLAPIVPVQSFRFENSSYTFDRNGGAVSIHLEVFPAGSNEFFNWSLSSNTVASIKAYADYAVLTPKKSGTVTLSASAIINGEEVVKSVNVTFEDGKIYEASLSDTTPSLYEAVTVYVTTDRSVKSIHLQDMTNSLSEEYSSYVFFEDTGNLREWELPFFFKRESTSLRVWGSDALGNLSTMKYLELNATMPENAFAANPPVIMAQVGESVPFNLINLPSRSNILYSKYSVTVAEELASFSYGYLDVYKAGESTLHCEYNGETRDVRFIAFDPITKITLPSQSVKLSEGEHYLLQVQTKPESDEKLRFLSDNPAVASVDESGEITAIGEGNATVQVISESGVSAAIRVAVKTNEQVEYLVYEKAEYACAIGETADCKLLSNLTSLTNKIEYSLSNTNIARVSEDGVLTALKEGTVTLTATAANGITAQTQVNVTAVRHLMLNRAAAQSTPHNSFYISTYISPDGADVDGFWYTDDEQVAVIAQNGYVSTKQAGICNLYFISDRGEIATCTLTVNSLDLKSVTLAENDISLDLNDNYIISYRKNSSLADETPRFQSANTAIAAVDENGIIYATGEGETTVTVILNNGTTYPIHVSVSEKSASLSGTVNCPALLEYYGSCTGEQSEDIDKAFQIESMKRDSYTLCFSAPHHTMLTVEQVYLNKDISLGEIYLHNGDANEDGCVDIADISLILKEGNFMADAVSAGETLDINDDGNINIADIAQILLERNYGGTDRVITY